MKNKVEVIIPSLGDNKLKKTLQSLNQGSLKPKKIICFINSNKKMYLNKKYKNVKIYYTLKKGQIIQRLNAFKKTKEKLILQLDDDIILEKNCLKNLVNCLVKIGKGNVVGPVYNNLNDKPLHKIKRKNFQIFYNLYHYLICNSKYGNHKSGSLTPIFLTYGIDSSIKIKNKIYKTDWLPGGCVLSFRSDFVQKPNFPFKGKAYCEDVFYSILRVKKNIKHKVVSGAIVKTSSPNNDLASFFKEIKIRRYLVKNFSTNKMIRFYNWVFFEFLKRIFLKLNK